MSYITFSQTGAIDECFRDAHVPARVLAWLKTMVASQDSGIDYIGEGMWEMRLLVNPLKLFEVGVQLGVGFKSHGFVFTWTSMAKGDNVLMTIVFHEKKQ